ncbi:MULTISPECIES: isopenicillin N synthase family oxygenase [unclassified Mesorhizobium]|uniref:isopenicillin N synthase family dioxygenase n=1 Tax=unclassified Mesorhizobium TaxID=325217 RepID=UPI000FD77615|nr:MULTISPECIES: 2-oxoglutarate and iron-dependent oxygenase domain-containing protein [unclassified Mesorhizobium]RWE25123.1 MAG: isopenicillin N synthase family oxygenase [Mesorhizobium sp.]TGQ18995.1 isopenicillin N synthase family oxygenase [Mesorhizobium sp. M00.F.Ca.ET.217.01.1.1]TGV90142.1 isopenicillin N synthase family oxygenase [Mesorhizobium sp. M00.F.Ca.ET.158.01.1.1]
MAKSNVAQLDDRLRAQRQSFDKVPLVNLAPLLDGSDPGQVAKQIRWALANVGFMYVKNHGVPVRLIDESFAKARAFFDLPTSEKMKLHVSNSGVALRGYIEVFGENTDPAKTKDLKECFDVGPEWPTIEGPFFGPNQWPMDLLGFQETIFLYHETMKALSTKILSGIALSLDLAADFFEPKMENPISIQRLLHYPPQSGVVDESVIGIGTHTDYGSLTILAQDSAGGLQVMNRDGVWVEGNPIPDTFVINIGDLIQKLTNDCYLANLHRVVNTSGRERYSLAFFIDGDCDAVITPLDSCVSEDNPPRYPSTTCGAHKFARFLESFPHLQREHTSDLAADRTGRPAVL